MTRRFTPTAVTATGRPSTTTLKAGMAGDLFLNSGHAAAFSLVEIWVNSSSEGEIIRTVLSPTPGTFKECASTAARVCARRTPAETAHRRKQANKKRLGTNRGRPNSGRGRRGIVGRLAKKAQLSGDGLHVWLLKEAVVTAGHPV